MAKSAAEKTLLLVEDEEALREVLGEELEKGNVRLFEARDGAEGLRIALREHPDLIVLDLLMPTMDGMTMLARLREDEWGRNAPVVILTNVERDVPKTLAALEHDVYEFIVKTRWSLEDLVLHIKEKLYR